MPIPIYKAQIFERKMKGGRNNPWLLTVKTESVDALYVAKFFVEQDINQQNVLIREIYANILAKELGLNVPDFALITVDNHFKNTLTDELLQQLERKHTQYAFGTKFIDHKYTFSPALHTRELAGYDVASIFAFDALVLNTDRRKGKPNILLDGHNQYFLIDHEHTFSLTMENLNSRHRIAAYNFKQHIFHKVLRNKPMAITRNLTRLKSFFIT